MPPSPLVETMNNGNGIENPARIMDFKNIVKSSLLLLGDLLK